MPEYEDVYEAPVLDATGQDMAAAIRELKSVIQPTNVCVDLDVSLEVSGWSNSAPYVYNWMNNKVTTECAVKVNYLEGAEDTDDLYIGYEKIVGGIQFESPTKPTAAIPVRIHIVNAEADSITNIDDEMVSSDVISGASNVKQALTSLKNADVSLSEQIGTYRTWTRLMNNVAFNATGFFGSFDLTQYKEVCVVLDTQKASDNQPFQYKNAITIPADMISANGYIFAVPLVVGEFVKFALFTNQVSINEIGALPASANAYLITIYAR